MDERLGAVAVLTGERSAAAWGPRLSLSGALVAAIVLPGCGSERAPAEATQELAPAEAAPETGVTIVDARARILQALLCAAPDGSLQAVRELADDPASTRADGISVSANGLNGEDERVELLFEPPMQLPFGVQDARIRRVELSFDSPQPGFGAVVFAEVEGDAQAAIAALALQPGEEHPGAIAPWSRPGKPRNLQAGGAEDDICPPMVGLAEIEPGRYLLGCGWCNG